MEIKYDPVEDTKEYKQIKAELEIKIKQMIGENTMIGYCHMDWDAKKLILKRDYNIDWKSPAELNPRVIFD